MRTATAIAVLLLPPLAAVAGEPGPGKTTTVECMSNPEQKYCCYVPKAYTPKKAWPILYCFAPDGNGAAFVQRYGKVCEERGWIVVGSMNSRNGPWEPIKAAIDAMWADTEARFNLSKTMRYASGFSGGARVSFGLAEIKPEFIAGVIAIGAGLGSQNQGALPRKELAVWIACGETDFNRKEIEALAPRLKEAGNAVKFEMFPGEHQLPPQPMMEDAVRFMDDRSGERRAEKLALAMAEAEKLRDAGEPVKGYLVLVDVLESHADVTEGRRDAEKLRKDLERLPEVKPEAKALKACADAEAWIEKNRSRMEKSSSVRAQALKKLRSVAERHAGTRGAERATAAIAGLEGAGD